MGNVLGKIFLSLSSAPVHLFDPGLAHGLGKVSTSRSATPAVAGAGIDANTAVKIFGGLAHSFVIPAAHALAATTTVPLFFITVDPTASAGGSTLSLTSTVVVTQTIYPSDEPAVGAAPAVTPFLAAAPSPSPSLPSTTFTTSTVVITQTVPSDKQAASPIPLFFITKPPAAAADGSTLSLTSTVVITQTLLSDDHDEDGLAMAVLALSQSQSQPLAVASSPSSTTFTTSTIVVTPTVLPDEQAESTDPSFFITKSPMAVAEGATLSLTSTVLITQTVFPGDGDRLAAPVLAISQSSPAADTGSSSSASPSTTFSTRTIVRTHTLSAEEITVTSTDTAYPDAITVTLTDIPLATATTVLIPIKEAEAGTNANILSQGAMGGFLDESGGGGDEAEEMTPVPVVDVVGRGFEQECGDRKAGLAVVSEDRIWDVEEELAKVVTDMPQHGTEVIPGIGAHPAWGVLGKEDEDGGVGSGVTRKTGEKKDVSGSIASGGKGHKNLKDGSIEFAEKYGKGGTRRLEASEWDVVLGVIVGLVGRF
jgi:hypothetical protein